MSTAIAPPVDPRPPVRAESEPPSSSRTVGRWARMPALVAVVGTLLVTREPIGILVVLFVLVVPMEKLFPRHRGQRIRRPQVGTDIAHAIVAPALQAVTIALAVPLALASLAWLPGLAIRPLVAQIPAVAMPLVGLALFDFVIYWTHRWGHEVPYFWRFHAIHHSTEHLDWVSGFRNHPLDGVFIAPAFVFLLAAGFSAEYTGVLTIVQIVTGIFLHANVRWRWRPLHRIVITPEFHHWHHTNEPEAHHSNYSVFLPLWDIVFGTYYMPADRRPSRYGVDEFVPAGLVPQLLHPLRGMPNPLAVIGHPRRSFRAGRRLLAAVLRSVWRSTRRPTHAARRASGEEGYAPST